MSFTFAVVADTHIHPPDDARQSGWPSDAEHNDRSRRVVALLDRLQPDFVVHLGDVPHPVPGLAAHEVAMSTAQAIWSELRCPLHVVPGNHDVGDKPHPTAPAPRTDPALHDRFTERWGPPWQSFTHRDVRFVFLDTPILGTGSEPELEQRAWLEDELAKPHRRFVFMHYPPFLCDPDEAEHYDNLGEPQRTWLVSLLRHAHVEAGFFGHVHHFFWNRVGGVELYGLPATSFVRPGYAELCRVPPSDKEFGRNEVHKLGLALVHVDERGHRFEPLDLPDVEGSSRAVQVPFGLTLRHSWAAPRELPADNIDPFARKQARNDLWLWRAWQLGANTFRVPVGDLLLHRERMAQLAERGHRWVVIVPGAPTNATWRLLSEHRWMLAAAEIVLPRGTDAPVPELELPPLWWSVVGQKRPDDSVYFSHFPQPGYRPDDTDAPEGAVFLVRDAQELAAVARRATACVLPLPRADESATYDDDEALARLIAEVAAVAGRHPDLPVFLDALIDHDRGYHTRIGLLDRLYRWRRAGLVLREP